MSVVTAAVVSVAGVDDAVTGVVAGAGAGPGAGAGVGAGAGASKHLFTKAVFRPKHDNPFALSRVRNTGHVSLLRRDAVATT